MSAGYSAAGFSRSRVSAPPLQFPQQAQCSAAAPTIEVGLCKSVTLHCHTARLQRRAKGVLRRASCQRQNRADRNGGCLHLQHGDVCEAKALIAPRPRQWCKQPPVACPSRSAQTATPAACRRREACHPPGLVYCHPLPPLHPPRRLRSALRHLAEGCCPP